MQGKKRIMEIKSERNASVQVTSSNIKTLAWATMDCRRFLQSKTEQYRNLEPEARKNKMQSFIRSYVMDLKVGVDGFMEEGASSDSTSLKTAELTNKLIESIQSYDFLTAAMNNPDINEIRCNGKELKVEIKGRCRDLLDENDRILSFESPEQQLTIISKLLGDVRFSRKDAVISARTVEGYRIAVVHSSALGDDPNAPNDEKYHAFVLRKFSKSKMDLSDIVRYGTMSDNMARFLSIAMEGGLTFFTAGPTASGKSTTNNAILQYVPADKRVVLLQNPSEIDLRMKDETGRTYNDVIHLEYIDKDKPGPHDPTSENMMAQILRLSPDFVAFGEWRYNREFKLGIQIGQAGHPLNSTLHADSSLGAVSRIHTAYLSESNNEPSELALIEITELLNIVIVQKIMRDGTRKVLQITEVLGVEKDNPNVPALNDLYKFVLEGDPIYDDKGFVEKQPGYHKRVGQLNEKTINKLKLEAVALRRVDFLLTPPDENEVETYTGDDIKNYNKFLKKDSVA